jgi:transcriptional regulator with XRE-family HTH domain
MSVPAEMENPYILLVVTDTTSMGRFIRESRLQRGMSLGQLAASIDRSPSSVRRWERDEVAPAIAVMPQLALALDVEVSELEIRRPTATEPDRPADQSQEGKKPITIEQPVVAAEDSPSLAATRPPATGRVGFVGEMWNSVFDEKESWIGWVRGIATALGLVFMFFVLVWAGGEFIDAITDVWDSFGSGSSSGS